MPFFPWKSVVGAVLVASGSIQTLEVRPPVSPVPIVYDNMPLITAGPAIPFPTPYQFRQTDAGTLQISSGDVLQVWNAGGDVVATIPDGDRPDLRVKWRPGARVVIPTPARVWVLEATDAGTWTAQP